MTVKGGANGDYHNVVLAPASVQEAVNMVMEAFDIADQYLLPVIILADGLIGQMMEPVEFNYVPRPNLPEKNMDSGRSLRRRKKQHQKPGYRTR